MKKIDTRRRAVFGMALGLSAALLLGGCFKVSNSLPADAPSYIHLYPGAKQVIQIDVGGLKSLAFQAPDTVDNVMAYYRTQAASDQMPEAQVPPQQNAPADQKQAAFGDPASDKFLVVVARPQAPGSMISLTYKPAGKKPS